MTRELILLSIIIILVYVVDKLRKSNSSGKQENKKNTTVSTPSTQSDIVVAPNGDVLPKILDAQGNLRQIQPTDPYIKPVEFKIGFINNGGKTANLGDENTLYPINGLKVEYGSKAPTNFPGERFIRSI
jgi:hypothetical protein